MKSVVQIQRQGKVKDVRASAAASGLPAKEIETKVALIQALIPLGLHAVGEELEAEVVALAGARYRRTGGQAGVVRWGQQRGSVYLADQKLPIPVPRVRDRAANREVSLTTYEQLQRPRAADAGLFRKVLVGLTCLQYKACAEAVPEAFGLSASSVSRRFIRASARHLQTLCERRLDRDEFVALVLDGKTFAEDALGIALQGQKQILGFVQTATENERVCAAFLRELLTRGLRIDHGLLCVIDGAKGLRRAIQTVFGAQALVQRCQWHKRENVVRYLPKTQQAAWRRRLQQAYERPTYAEARAALGRLRQELRGLNVSAVASLDEGLEETLTLPAWPGAVSDSGGQPEDHQLSGIPQCPARPAHRQGGSLAHVGPETALGGQCADPHRAASAADQRLPPSPAVARGAAGQDREGRARGGNSHCVMTASRPLRNFN